MIQRTIKPSSIALDVIDDAALGAELTALYHDANDGFRRVLRFGARFLQAEKLVLATRDENSPKSGPGSYGFATWLREYAPAISEPTARRYRDVTEALAKKYKIADPVLCFSAPATDLPPAEAAQQAKALDFVAEKSIRQVQLELNLIEPAKIGGARVRTKQLTQAEQDAEWLENNKRRAVVTFSSVHSLGERWKLLPDSQLRQALTDAKALVAQLDAWLKLPPPSRTALTAAKLMEGLE